jgi:flagellar protein FliO/FliZ
LKRLATKLPPAFLLCILSSLPLISVCFGNTGPSADNGENPDFQLSGYDSFLMIVKVLFFLLIIIGLFFVIIRALAKRNETAIFGRSIRSLGGIPLGQNKSVQILSIGRALYIVGVGDNIQLLEKIEDEEQVASLTELLSSGGGAAKDIFPLGKWLSGLRNRQTDVEEEELSSSSFGQLFQEKLQQISINKKKAQEQLHEQQTDDRLSPK